MKIFRECKGLPEPEENEENEEKDEKEETKEKE